MEKLVGVGAGHPLSVAVSYIAALVVLCLVLSIRVIAMRRSQKIGIGDGDDRDLRRRIRAHGNFSEYAPILMILLLALPLVGAKEWQVHLVGVIGLVGRTLHAIGLSRYAGASLQRVGGMVMTAAALAIGAIMLLVRAWF